MSRFIGDFKEFNSYVGPKLRNTVQTATRKFKNEKGGCEYCNTSIEDLTANGVQLEAAHKHEFGTRPDKIREILENNHKIGENEYDVNLENFLTEFKDAHEDTDKIFLALCHDCHIEYDK